MLGMKAYSQEYVDACRARVDGDRRAYAKDCVRLADAFFAEIEKRYIAD
jgi:hypothetical protein